jgi:hypothetical protein
MLFAAKLTTMGLLLLGRLGTAFQFTSEHPYGAYSVSYSESGEEVYELLDVNFTASVPPPPPGNASAPWRLARRSYLPSSAYPTCNSDGAVVDYGDFYHNAYNKFWSTCATAGRVGKNQHLAVYDQSNTVAFMCSYSNTNPCDVNEWWQAVNDISQKCNYLNLNWKQCGKALRFYSLL